MIDYPVFKGTLTLIKGKLFESLDYLVQVNETKPTKIKELK